MTSFPNLFIVLLWLAYLNASTIAAGSNITSIPFRIMALGASVTFGVGSTTGDSYRKSLEDLLVSNGSTVEYVGTKKNGNFSDNAVEATPGFIISQIAAAANGAVPQLKPNLVLIDAGTNNCNNGGTVPDAGANITSLINNTFNQSPGATVILTTILVNSVAKQDACRISVNTQYTALATTLQAAGAKMILVDMRGPGGPLVTDLADGRHPNDAGYVKMANIWFQGIQEAVSKNLLTEASAISSSPSSTNSASGEAALSTTSNLRNSTSPAGATNTQGTMISNTPATSISSRTPFYMITTFAAALRFTLYLLLINIIV